MHKFLYLLDMQDSRNPLFSTSVEDTSQSDQCPGNKISSVGPRGPFDVEEMGVRINGE